MSQKALGWVLVGDRYEDGGYSGGNLERPALKRLLADIELRKVDVVLVYKLDRISRSLMDFAKLIEVFESHQITFVSVTQSFNTTSSMGRLTLNMLLSFAQFEREVIGERTRDKIAASRRKGMWMGGNVPLGYDAKDRKLVINKAEAAWVRTVFERFVQTGSVTKMLPALHAEGLRTKTGKPADKSYLYKLLNNRVYLGDAVHKGTAYPGEHKAIIDRKLWDRVHALLQESPRKRAAATRAQTPALLKGLLFGPTGITMTPTHTRRGGRLYRYYICSGMLRHGKDAAADRETASLRRIAAGEIERAVIDQIRVLLRTPEIIVQTWRAARASRQADRSAGQRRITQLRAALERAISCRAGTHRPAARRSGRCRARRHSNPPEDRGTGHPGRRSARRQRWTAPHEAEAGRFQGRKSVTVRVPLTFRQQGGRKLIVVPGGAEPTRPPPNSFERDAMVKALARAFRWRRLLESGDYASIGELAEAQGVNFSYMCRVLRLTLLSPKIVESILDGRVGSELSLNVLLRPNSPVWAEQDLKIPLWH